MDNATDIDSLTFKLKAARHLTMVTTFQLVAVNLQINFHKQKSNKIETGTRYRTANEHNSNIRRSKRLLTIRSMLQTNGLNYSTNRKLAVETKLNNI